MYERISAIETLYNTVLTPDLNTNIIRSLPIELRISFNKKYTAFINLDTDNNIRSPAVFKFLNQYVENLNNSFKANPKLLFYHKILILEVGATEIRKTTFVSHTILRDP